MKTTSPNHWNENEIREFVLESMKNGCRNISDLKKMPKGQPVARRINELKLDVNELFQKGKKPCNMSKEELFKAADNILKKNGYVRGNIGSRDFRKLPGTAGIYKHMGELDCVNEYFGLKETHPQVNGWTKEQCLEAIKKEGYKSLSDVYKDWLILAHYMDKQGWLHEYFDTNKRLPITTVINSFIENIDFWDALTIPEILGLASAFGDYSLMNKMLKKLAKSGPESEERKFMLDSIKEMEEMSEDEALEEINKDEDDEVKENDMIEEIVKAAENMPSDEVEYTNELERIGKVMVGMERLQSNKDIMNIINSGNVIKTLKDSITKRILLLSFEHPQVFDELEQKYCK